MTDKFKSRYVLWEGYPWKLDHTDNFMYEEKKSPLTINMPDELMEVWAPKYRLVLERIDE